MASSDDVFSARAKTGSEPQLITQTLIQGTLDAKEIDFPELLLLQLSYKNLLEISGLQVLKNLRILKLDNNLIKRIENLSHLDNLESLDLSFNQIERIEGLSSLTRLKDLSLYQNKVFELSGLDALQNLRILSVGNNQIKGLKQIERLRQLSHLRSVSFKGNPIVESAAFYQHVYAYLPQLTHLDYQLINKKGATEIIEAYHSDEIADIREKEYAKAKQEALRKDAEMQNESLRASFLDATADLSLELFSTELFQLTMLSGYQIVKDEAKDKIVEASRDLQTQVAQQNAERIKLVAELQTFIASYDKKQQELLISMVKSQSPTPDLMRVATESFDAVCARIEAVESEVVDIIKYISEKGTEYFKVLEEIQRATAQKLHEIASEELDLFASGRHLLSGNGIPQDQDQEAEVDIEDVKNRSQDDPEVHFDSRKAAALANKDEVISGLGSFNDNQAGILQQRDDQMQAQLNKWASEYFRQLRKEALMKYESRVIEISSLFN
jgi:Leucine-rich repeat (LRR) protein